MEEAAARRAAEVLLAEHKSGAPFRPFPLRDGPATISDAYDIQDRLVFLLRRQHGRNRWLQGRAYVSSDAIFLRYQPSDRRCRSGETRSSIENDRASWGFWEVGPRI